MGTTAYLCCRLHSLQSCIKNEENSTSLQSDGILVNVPPYKALQSTKY